MVSSRIVFRSDCKYYPRGIGLDALHNSKKWKQNVDAPAQVVYANKLKEGAVDKSLKKII